MTSRTPNTLTQDQIKALIPHREPFLLVDKILDFEPGQWIRGSRKIHLSDPVFKGHFPGRPIYPGVLIVESMAQTGGCLLMQEVEDPQNKVIYFMSLEAIKFRKPVNPGDELLMEIKVLSFKSRTSKMRGETFVGGVKVAEAEFVSMLQPLPNGGI
ncbi:MAG: 3-hydroxyacyl-ACP dehydratase FabZ [Holophagaceae bacterium]